MVHIYILKLEDNKYYVGKTNNLSNRLKDHKTNNGSLWTQKYKPIDIYKIYEDCDDFDEDKYTIMYMEQFGIINVRGGSFSQIKLNKDNINIINKMFRNANNQCFICGSKEHFVNTCSYKENNEIKMKKKSKEKCDCPASFLSPHRKKKCLLNNIFNFDNECDNIDELSKLEFEKEEEEKEEKENKKNDYKCYRCGRKGHFISNCYAKTHINGNELK